MTRIKLQERKEYKVFVNLDVRVSDLNYGAHLGYDHLLSLAHQARVEYFSNLGVTEFDLGDKKTGIVITDMIVQYRREAFLGDKLLFEISPFEVGQASFRLAYRVTNKTSNRPTALIEMGLAAFDLELRRTGKLPDKFRQMLETTVTQRTE